MNYTDLFFILFSFLVLAQILKTLFIGIIITRFDDIKTQLRKLVNILKEK